MWFSIILNSSGGWGILPVSSLDHSGLSFIDISKAAVDNIRLFTSLQTKNNMIHEYSLFLVHHVHQDAQLISGTRVTMMRSQHHLAI